MRASSRKAALLIGIALLAGCTSTTAGNATPDAAERPPTTSEHPPATSDELPTDGAPKVADPIDTSGFEQDACQVLTADQLRELGLESPGEAVENAFGPECQWENESIRAWARIVILSEDPRGLSPTYAANERGEWEYFVELPLIEGHPAVARAGVDDRPKGVCSLEVGASDEIAFEVVARVSEGNVGKKDPCDVGAIVAGMVLETMKAG